MSEDINTYNAEIAKQEASPAQKAAEISQDEIHSIYEKLAIEASGLYAKKHQWFVTAEISRAQFSHAFTATKTLKFTRKNLHKL